MIEFSISFYALEIVVVAHTVYYLGEIIKNRLKKGFINYIINTILLLNLVFIVFIVLVGVGYLTAKIISYMVVFRPIIDYFVCLIIIIFIFYMGYYYEKYVLKTL